MTLLGVALLLASVQGLAVRADGQPAGQTIQLFRKAIDTSLTARIASFQAELAMLSKRYNNIDNPWTADFVESDKNLTKRADPSSGSLDLRSVGNDGIYYGTVAVGTPAVNFDVVLDTGSADFWLSDKTCTECAPANTYDPSKSSTSKDLNRTFKTQYVIGAASGELYSDTVSLAGFALPDQPVAAVDSASAVGAGISGLMGLAARAVSTTDSVPFVDALVAAGSLTDNLFTFVMSRHRNTSTSVDAVYPGGVMTLGYVDQSLYTGSIQTLPVTTSEGHWTVALDGINVNGESFTARNHFAVIDTGTTLIGGPLDAVTALYNEIPNSRVESKTGGLTYFSYPCSQPVSVSLEFGGKAYPMENADFQVYTSSSTRCVGSFFATDPSSTQQNLWIVGASWMKNVYSIFTIAPTRSIGFASLSQKSIDISNGKPISTTNSTTGGNNTGAASSGYSNPLLALCATMLALFTVALM